MISWTRPVTRRRPTRRARALATSGEEMKREDRDQRAAGHLDARTDRYRIRPVVERTNARLKDAFGARYWIESDDWVWTGIPRSLGLWDCVTWEQGSSLIFLPLTGLKRWCGAQKHVWRAGIVLLSATGMGTNAIMRETGKSKTCVWRWQERFAEEGVEGLRRDKTGPRRIAPLPPEVAEAVGISATATRSSSFS